MLYRGIILSDKLSILILCIIVAHTTWGGVEREAINDSCHLK